MRIKFLAKWSFSFLATFFCSTTYAAEYDTQRGKILTTQGHVVPSCRMVLFQENATGNQRWFRILDNAGARDDISAVVLTALTTNRDVAIHYDPAVTTGCGPEPKIQIISVY
jgi:hypothetical protein